MRPVPCVGSRTPFFRVRERLGERPGCGDYASPRIELPRFFGIQLKIG